MLMELSLDMKNDKEKFIFDFWAEIRADCLDAADAAAAGEFAAAAAGSTGAQPQGFGAFSRGLRETVPAGPPARLSAEYLRFARSAGKIAQSRGGRSPGLPEWRFFLSW